MSPRRTLREGIRHALVKVINSLLLGSNCIPWVFDHSSHALHAFSNYAVILASVRPNTKRFVSSAKLQTTIPGCLPRVSYSKTIYKMKRIRERGDPYGTPTNTKYSSDFSLSK